MSRQNQESGSLLQTVHSNAYLMGKVDNNPKYFSENHFGDVVLKIYGLTIRNYLSKSNVV